MDTCSLLIGWKCPAAEPTWWVKTFGAAESGTTTPEPRSLETRLSRLRDVAALISILHFIYEVSTRTWAVSLDPWPNRTWGCVRILIFYSAQACCVRIVASVRRNYTRERFFSTLLDLLTAIGLYMSTCKKNNTHKISRIFRTKCQKSFRSYVHQHACAEKLTYFYICLLKIYGMHAQNNHL